MPPKRVLLLYISPDSGHHRATLAIEKALHKLQPDCVTVTVNALHSMNPLLERVIKKSYFGLIRIRPEVWGYLYDNPSVVKRSKVLRGFIHRFNSPKFQTLLEELHPDVIVCTQAFPCGLVADVKKSHRLSTPLIGVLTDYLPHSYWAYEGVDFYVVPTERSKAKLSKNGVPPEKILTYGIPIDPKFSVNGKKEVTLSHYGLSPELPIVLVMGGSQGVGPLLKVTKALDRTEMSLQLLILCGNNLHLYTQLLRWEREARKKIRVFDFIEEVDALMDVATLLITKPGGVTTAEALAKNLPLVILDPIRGQETSNANFLIEEGLAVLARDEEEVVGLVRDLLAHPMKLEEMRRRARLHQKPESAVEIARRVLSL